MHRILALIDFSDRSPAVAKAATDLAVAYDAKLYFVHVAAPDSDIEGDKLRENVSRQGISTELRRKRRDLHLMETVAKKRNVAATSLLVRTKSIRGNPVRKILHEMSRLKPTLIVAGTHSHGMLHRLLLGSVSEAILRNAPCPVLLLPSNAKKANASD